MIDRARVYVHQTNALIMFVCFTFATFIINSIITYTHTRAKRRINFCFIFSDSNQHLRNNDDVLVVVMIEDDVMRTRLYKTCHSLLTQVDRSGGH